MEAGATEWVCVLVSCEMVIISLIQHDCCARQAQITVTVTFLLLNICQISMLESLVFE